MPTAAERSIPSMGTAVQAAERLPRHLVADEKHTTLAGEKVFLAATAGGGCCLGMALAETADEDDVLWVVLAGAVMSALIGGRLVPLGLVP
jgi:hypothetical protein